MKYVFFALSLCFCTFLQAADVDQVVVDKSKHRLLLLNGDTRVREFSVAFGGEPQGHKQQEGDQKTPEGLYILDYKKADSAFYKAIHISYPNAEDKAHAAKKGVDPGGFIMIHGQKNGFGFLAPIMQLFNWTDGCIALSNKDMEDLWNLVQVGTPIQINP